jgi:hypothetical protein
MMNHDWAVVTQQLYERSQIVGTLLELFPSERPSWGSGSSHSIKNSLTMLEAQIRRSNLSTEELISVLDFAFTALYESCPTILNESRVASENGTRYHFCASLAMKVVILLAIKLYPHCNNDPKRFAKLADLVAHQYYQFTEGDCFTRKIRNRKVTLDQFFSQAVYFVRTSRFISLDLQRFTRSIEKLCDVVLKEPLKAEIGFGN